MLRWFRLALVLGLVAVPVAASSIERIETRYDDIVGFYESDGSRYRVTWRPAGGLYLIAIDPEHTSQSGGPTLVAVTVALPAVSVTTLAVAQVSLAGAVNSSTVRS